MNASHKCTIPECHICEFSRRLSKAKSGTKAEMRKALDEYANEIYCAESDLDWHKCVLNGTWPNAREILARSLAKAKIIAKGRKAK